MECASHPPLYSFDRGTDDVVYSGCNARSPNDAANFLAFVKVLRNQLGPSALLTAAVGTTGIMGPSGGPLGDYSEFKNYLSYINLMTVSPIPPPSPLRLTDNLLLQYDISFVPISCS